MSYKTKMTLIGVLMIVVPLVILLLINNVSFLVVLKMMSVIALLAIAITGVGILLRLYDP